MNALPNNSVRGKVTKLPDSMNPNKLIMEAMEEKYGICPFCGENRRVDFLANIDKAVRKDRSESWYGTRKESFFSNFKFWEPSHHWRIDKWKCKTCGAEWESEPFPTDIAMGKDLSGIFTYKIGELGIADVSMK